MIGLPYFQFYPGEWSSGRISDFDYKEQGVFIAVCSWYWQRECHATDEMLRKRFRYCLEEIDSLIDANLICIKSDEVSIKWLDLHYIDLLGKKERNISNGHKGAEIKKLKAMNKQGLSESNSESNSKANSEANSDTESGAEAFRIEYNIIEDNILNEDKSKSKKEIYFEEFESNIWEKWRATRPASTEHGGHDKAKCKKLYAGLRKKGFLLEEIDSVIYAQLGNGEKDPVFVSKLHKTTLESAIDWFEGSSLKSEKLPDDFTAAEIERYNEYKNNFDMTHKDALENIYENRELAC